ncbi:MAG TPA: hypothetical protein VMH23_00005, partial [Bacteroidota bacterium]|nr:hypothetical protein [Bacteroidota bacterium]
MSRLFSICTIALLAAAIGQAQGIDGKWKGEMQGPNGPFELTFKFKVVGDSLTGAVVGQMGEMPISNGKVKGTSFSFDVNVNDMNISHQCTFMSDSISMKVQGFQGEPMVLMLKRAPDSDTQS